MPRQLLVVESAFVVQRALIVLPEPALDDVDARALDVELRRPDGTSTVVPAKVKLPHLAPADRTKAQRKLLAFDGLTPDDVPLGTAVWTI